MITTSNDNQAIQATPKPENLAKLVLLLRGEKVLLDADLAELYGVEARTLNQAVSRNRNRFPDDFMFQLTTEEWNKMRSQTVTASKSTNDNSSQTVMSSSKHRGLAYRPYAFTEQGVAMLSSVLRSQRAVEVNIATCGVRMTLLIFKSGWSASIGSCAKVSSPAPANLL